MGFVDLQAASRVGVNARVDLNVANGGSNLESRTIFALGNSEVIYAAQGPLGADIAGATDYPGSSGYGQARASADYGVLRAYGSGHAGTTPTLGWSGNGSGAAIFEDTWTISAPGLNGTPGTITFKMSISGSVVGRYYHPGVANGAWWSLVLDEDVGRAVGSWDYALGQGTPAATPTFTRAFIYGQPMNFRFTFSAGSGANVNDPVDSVADYERTCKLDGVWVSNAGSVITNFALLADSGHNYTFTRLAPPRPPVLSAIWATSSNTCLLTVSAETNLFYRVQSSTNLSDWTDLMIVAATNEVFTVGAPAAGLSRFYRLVFK